MTDCKNILSREVQEAYVQLAKIISELLEDREPVTSVDGSEVSKVIILSELGNIAGVMNILRNLNGRHRKITNFFREMNFLFEVIDGKNWGGGASSLAVRFTSNISQNSTYSNSLNVLSFQMDNANVGLETCDVVDCTSIGSNNYFDESNISVKRQKYDIKNNDESIKYLIDDVGNSNQLEVNNATYLPLNPCGHDRVERLTSKVTYHCPENFSISSQVSDSMTNLVSAGMSSDSNSIISNGFVSKNVNQHSMPMTQSTIKLIRDRHEEIVFKELPHEVQVVYREIKDYIVDLFKDYLLSGLCKAIPFSIYTSFIGQQAAIANLMLKLTGKYRKLLLVIKCFSEELILCECKTKGGKNIPQGSVSWRPLCNIPQDIFEKWRVSYLKKQNMLDKEDSKVLVEKVHGHVDNCGNSATDETCFKHFTNDSVLSEENTLALLNTILCRSHTYNSLPGDIKSISIGHNICPFSMSSGSSMNSRVDINLTEVFKDSSRCNVLASDICLDNNLKITHLYDNEQPCLDTRMSHISHFDNKSKSSLQVAEHMNNSVILDSRSLLPLSIREYIDSIDGSSNEELWNYSIDIQEKYLYIRNFLLLEFLACVAFGDRLEELEIPICFIGQRPQVINVMKSLSGKHRSLKKIIECFPYIFQIFEKPSQVCVRLKNDFICKLFKFL